MRHRTVENVMTRDPATATAGTGFTDLVRIMADRRVSGLPVVDADGRVLGVVSEADLLAKESVRERPHAVPALLRRHAERVRSRGTTAGELMTAPAVTVASGADVPHAARLMADHRVKRLPVVDADGALVGVVSRSDLLSIFTRADDDIAEEIAHDVFHDALGIGADTVAIRVAGGVVEIGGQVERRSWVDVITALTRRVDGVVDVRSTLTYAWDDTGVTIPEAMVVDITREPRR
ncbi:CBS domain-containing protein [Actinokineospora auranticolor]|uniref:CBS domain protein n=1 Tax=Actinokineospora auranticolor TaxID=155976 RepID=A0A2S6GPZ4_9PSEU|nr:CBS domain-containing protein [Actinokineospora auranticolor]PPK67233.1 CBS domain protein [Actinokineospora auranticolor]